jgi:hypothetical protein
MSEHNCGMFLVFARPARIKVGGWWAGEGIFIGELQKKAGRGWHHHSRALHRRSMGQGGITGCRDDSSRQKSFPSEQRFF